MFSLREGLDIFEAKVKDHANNAPIRFGDLVHSVELWVKYIRVMYRADPDSKPLFTSTCTDVPTDLWNSVKLTIRNTRTCDTMFYISVTVCPRSQEWKLERVIAQIGPQVRICSWPDSGYDKYGLKPIFVHNPLWIFRCIVCNDILFCGQVIDENNAYHTYHPEYPMRSIVTVCNRCNRCSCESRRFYTRRGWCSNHQEFFRFAYFRLKIPKDIVKIILDLAVIRLSWFFYAWAAYQCALKLRQYGRIPEIRLWIEGNYREAQQ